MAGYSGTPLQKKLGIKEGFLILPVATPKNYFELVGKLPDDSKVVSSKSSDVDFIHLFVTSEKELLNQLPALKKRLAQDGMIWVSWYKKSAGMKTDVTEDIIRSFALSIGLVDVKVCAVDEVWSGLKLVIPVKDRKLKAK